MQNRAASIITNRSYVSIAPAEALMKELNYPTVRELIRCETAIIVFKSVNNLAPDYLSHFFIGNLLLLLMKTSNGQITFAFLGAKI